MNHLKDHIKDVYPTIHSFLTYADNYAIGYFKKQVRAAPPCRPLSAGRPAADARSP
jgi:hypothetical protein